MSVPPPPPPSPRAALLPAALLAAVLLPAGVPGLPLAPARAEEAVQVPSGQPVTFLDAILNEAGPQGQTARFRFLAPQIDAQVDFDTVVADMQHLCDTFALPRVSGTAVLPQQIVISLSAEPVPFGEPAPGVTQFFEAYSLQDGACIWEVF